MRRALYGITMIVLSSMCILTVGTGWAEERGSGELGGAITISGAWALYPMAAKWAEEFQKLHPKVKIDVSAGGAGKGIADVLAGMVDIGAVSRDIYPEEIKKGVWWIAVTKDAVVPTINENNPFVKSLLRQGVKKETFVDIWLTGKIKDWSAVTGGKGYSGYRIRPYTRSDACGAGETWAKYLGGKQEDLQGTGVYGDPGIAEAVRQDKLGIGFNNLNFAYDGTSKKPVEGILVLPIDTNNNGRLDKDEDFYRDRDTLVNAIITGKYPSPPARDLFFVCSGRPQKQVVTEFLRWVLTDGQKFVPDSGYIRLSDRTLRAELKRL